ncbi:uncharacterized protein FSUBG_9599 [Fusarium subglutinans]|uniref:Uncharacterized protein n=1 Tax=Gibberella subglutinans TaxID=42677 RepID=A0A8H5PC40_GIBSU|nr:uncharacterized protein FSUBG_9599 [Fusarium subglutinans]KAF5594026.1 hypothetical protein FSUBG_9599 [Fusarium subglutinans]
MSTDDALLSITDALTTLSLTAEATISTTKTNSFVESSRTSAGSTATKDYITVDGFTATEDSTTAENSIATEGSTTTEGATATQVSTTTTEAVTTTSNAPSIEPTFALQAANSIRENLNGKNLLYRKGASGYNIYVTVGASSANLYVTGDFHIEALTNRLVVGDMYASTDGTALVPQTAADVASNNRLYISCTPPVHYAQKLECVVKGTSRTQFHVFNNPSSFTVIYIFAPGSINSNNYSPFDLIVVPA